MFVTAISPWAIMFSRAGWEVNFATTLVLWGVNLFLLFLNKEKNKMVYFSGSILLLVLSMYTYHATRIIGPLIGLSLVCLWFNNTSTTTKFMTNFQRFINKHLDKLLISLFATLILLSPIT